FRLYMQKLNDSGGINGHPVELTVQDDRGEPTQAASNMRKFTDQGVHMVRNTSTSATFAPTMQEAKRANIPVVFTLTAPQEAQPSTPDPLFYLASHGIGTQSIWVYLDIMKTLTPSPKVGLLGLQIPQSSLQIQNMAKEAERMGIPALVKIVPADTVDITPVAQAFQEWGANWVFYTGPGAFSTMLFDALQKAGWKGNVLDQSASVPFETTEQKYKGNPNVFVGSAYVPFSEDLAPHKELKEAAQKYGVTSVNSLYLIGWHDGIVFSQILKQTGWPVTTDKLVNVMQNLKADRGPVMGPLKWTPTDHVGNYNLRIYKFQGDKLVGTGPWFVSDPLGQNRTSFKELKDIK
ncbi:MAG: ABC transporter substrate-binding protein, partial [Dehalococcoidia bacterium]|nr:ABC transporter substrate-binding protein [Dehalococcoidia bacterium]